jgi:hypothetical protein
MANTSKKSTSTSKTQAKSDKQGGQGSTGRRIGDISDATSQIVKEAGAILDEEMAIGIHTAKQMQERFDSERRIDSDDFQEALRRWQNDGHDLVALVDHQIAEIRSDENVDLTNRLMTNVHSLLDLIVGLTSTGTQVINQLIERNLPKTDDVDKR